MCIAQKLAGRVAVFLEPVNMDTNYLFPGFAARITAQS
jgi:hypothetical protein